MPFDLEQGCIVWVTIPDSQGGNPKERPAVVVSAGQDHQDGFVRVAALTTFLGRARFEETVAIRLRPEVRNHTKLSRESEVVCSWVIRVPIESVRPTEGKLPPAELAEVLEKVDRLT